MARPPLTPADFKPTTAVGQVLLYCAAIFETPLATIAKKARVDSANLYRIVAGRPLTSVVFGKLSRAFPSPVAKYSLAAAHLHDEYFRLGLDRRSLSIRLTPPVDDPYTPLRESGVSSQDIQEFLYLATDGALGAKPKTL